MGRQKAFDLNMSAELMAPAEALWKAAEAAMLDPSDPQWDDPRQKRLLTMSCATQMLISYALSQDDDIGPVLQALPYSAGVAMGQANPERAKGAMRAILEAFASGVEDAMMMNMPPPEEVGRA